ncbi:MAG: hypothetical protein WCI67_01710 [Chloroflexales bacterium]
MIKLELAPVGSRSQRAKALPRAGQRVRLTVHSAVELWQANLRVQYRAGEVYEGTVAAVIDDGLVDLRTDGGQQMRIYARDAAFEFESLE